MPQICCKPKSLIWLGLEIRTSHYEEAKKKGRNEDDASFDQGVQEKLAAQRDLQEKEKAIDSTAAIIDYSPKQRLMSPKF